LSDDEDIENPDLNVDNVEEYPGEEQADNSKDSILYMFIYSLKLVLNYLVDAPRKVEGPLVTTTTVHVIRIFGKYLHMMKILQPIAYEVFIGITQVFDFYVFAVYNLFSEVESEDKAGIVLISKYKVQLLWAFHRDWSTASRD
jgi:hypothetical protein